MIYRAQGQPQSIELPWQAWSALAAIGAFAIGAVVLLVMLIQANRDEIRDVRLNMDNIRVTLDNDVEIIDRRLEGRMNDLNSLLSHNMTHVISVVERAAGQAHSHNPGS